ncbi:MULTISPECIES: hypothetical protein [Haloferacaceae]|uniref:Uncharacterized protein n=2 Tax=Haloferacaceae TaxID=1644056 RepID=A0ABD6DC38_9EURY|nr:MULTISPECIES: hypothetical protein [Halorubraceae]
MEANTATEASPNSTDDEDEDPRIWTEIKRGTEGVSATVYKRENGQTTTVDETWWTWAEFTGISTQDLPISRGGTTRLEAAGPDDLTSAN